MGRPLGALCFAVAVTIAIAGCGSGKNNKAVLQPTSSRLAPSSAAAVTSTSLPAGSPSDGDNSTAAVEDRLLRVALVQSDVATYLQLATKRPLPNSEYSSQQQDRVAFDNALQSYGRISGILEQFIGPNPPPQGQSISVGLIVFLSSWKTDDGAHKGLALAMQVVAPATSAPNTATQEVQQVDLGQIGDETVANHIHLKPLTVGQPESDLYAVGARKGRTTVVVLVSGVNGSPKQDEVKQIVELQVKRLG